MTIATGDLVSGLQRLADQLRGTEHEADVERLLADAVAAQRCVLNILAVVGVAAVHVGLDIDLRESAVGSQADAVVSRVRAA